MARVGSRVPTLHASRSMYIIIAALRLHLHRVYSACHVGHDGDWPRSLFLCSHPTLPSCQCSSSVLIEMCATRGHFACRFSLFIAIRSLPQITQGGSSHLPGSYSNTYCYLCQTVDSAPKRWRGIRHVKSKSGIRGTHSAIFPKSTLEIYGYTFLVCTH